MSAICDVKCAVAKDLNQSNSSTNVSMANDVEETEGSVKQQILCVMCDDNVARYKCPGCLATTCSCACFKVHKEQTGCNGARDVVPTALGDETPEEMLMRDCRFLEEVYSKIEQSYRNPKFHHIVPKKQGRGMKRSADQQEESNPLPARILYGKQNPSLDLKQRFKHLIPNYPYRQWGQAAWQPSRFDLSRNLKKLRYEARTRQTTVSFLSRGMSRHIDNTSHYDEKSKAIRWRVRLVFVHADVYVERTVHEGLRLGQIVAQVLDTPLQDLRVWSCADPKTGCPSSDDGASKTTDTITDPFENGWSEPRSADDCPGSVHRHSSSWNVLDSESSNFCTGPQSSCITGGQASLELSLSNKISHSNEVDKDTENIPDNNDNTGSVQVKNSSKEGRNSSALLPFQDICVEPDDLFTSIFNPFVQQPNPYKLCPFTPLVKDLTPDPVVVPTHPPTPAEADQLLFYQAAGLGQLAVVFRHEMASDAQRYTLMDLTDTLKDNIAGLNVVEYPIMLVMRKDHVYEFLDRAAASEHAVPRCDAEREEAKEPKTESNSLKYFDADCSFDDEQ